MNLDLKISIHLNAVIQLVHEHTNRPLTQVIPRFSASCPVKIIRKENGMYAFADASEPQVHVSITLPLFETEETEFTTKFSGRVQVIRCSPSPKSVLGRPPANMTYFSGTAEAGKIAFLQCPVQYCDIFPSQMLPDGRILLESTNFMNADTHRCVLLKTPDGSQEFIRTMFEKKYSPRQYFASAEPLQKITSAEQVTAFPIFTARADSQGQFMAAAEEAMSGECIQLDENGQELRRIAYQAGGIVKFDES